jgi:CPA2 family monovalent cation:H+ antiporter-2
MEQESLRVVTLAPQKKWQGLRIEDAGLEALSVRLMSLRRANGEVANVDNTTFFQSGDTLVLSGHAEDLALAEQHLAALPGAEAQ